MRNQLNHRLKGCERFAAPIDRNVRKESVFDLIPFAGGRRQMTDSNGQASLRRQLLQLHLPQPVARAIGTACISHNQEFLTHGIELLSYVLPPASDTLHGKLRSFMVDTY